jgi:hypothetical protein
MAYRFVRRWQKASQSVSWCIYTNLRNHIEGSL